MKLEHITETHCPYCGSDVDHEYGLNTIRNQTENKRFLCDHEIKFENGKRSIVSWCMESPHYKKVMEKKEKIAKGLEKLLKKNGCSSDLVEDFMEELDWNIPRFFDSIADNEKQEIEKG